MVLIMVIALPFTRCELYDAQAGGMLRERGGENLERRTENHADIWPDEG